LTTLANYFRSDLTAKMTSFRLILMKHLDAVIFRLSADLKIGSTAAIDPNSTIVKTPTAALSA
jgi:hypothetical protein